MGSDLGDHRLGRRLRHQRAGGEHAGQRSKPLLAVRDIDDLVDQADPEGFVGVDQLAGEQDALGHRRTEQMRRPFERGTGIDDAELGRGDAEPRASGVAMRRSQSIAIEHPPPMQSPEMNATVGFGSSASASSAAATTSENGRSSAARATRELGDVGARAEVRPGAAQHDDSHVGVGAELRAPTLSSVDHIE